MQNLHIHIDYVHAIIAYSICHGGANYDRIKVLPA